MPSPDLIAQAGPSAIRSIAAGDLKRIAGFGFTVSITEPLTDPERLQSAFDETGFWQDDSGAVAIVEVASGRMIGTCQFYRAAPCIHGYELGYILHDPADRGRGLAAPAVRLFTDLVFEQRPAAFRLQLIIETWNVASWRLAERCGYVREGLLRSCGFGEGDPADAYIYSRTRKDWHEERISKMGVEGAHA